MSSFIRLQDAAAAAAELDGAKGQAREARCRVEELVKEADKTTTVIEALKSEAKGVRAELATLETRSILEAERMRFVGIERPQRIKPEPGQPK